MSGIFGFLNHDGAPANVDDLQLMAGILARRGPDGTGMWHAGSIGLGHTLLATTPEALFERLPLEHPASGCVITADVRLDNRVELLAALGLRDRAAALSFLSLLACSHRHTLIDHRHRCLMCHLSRLLLSPHAHQLRSFRAIMQHEHR